MAGLAKTNDFMLSTATVMIGAQADLWDLNPDDDAIGLVKNFTISSAPSYTELTQGPKNEIVFSTMTGNPVTASMEVYEYTAKNISYSLGLENADTVAPLTTETTLSEAVDGGSPGSTTCHVTSATGITADAYVMFLVDDDDNFVVRKVTNVNSLILTVNAALPDMPSGTVVKVVQGIGIGSKDDQPFYSAKIAGKLANGDEVVILIPKLRIVKGFNLAFVTNNFANLPFEFTVYTQVASDEFYSDFGGKQALLFRQ